MRLTAKNFVAPFTTEDHFDSQSLDLATEEVHRSTGSDRRDVVCLKMIYNLWNGVDTFLNREREFVVVSPKIRSDLSGSNQVGRVRQTNGE